MWSWSATEPEKYVEFSPNSVMALSGRALRSELGEVDQRTYWRRSAHVDLRSHDRLHLLVFVLASHMRSEVVQPVPPLRSTITAHWTSTANIAFSRTFHRRQFVLTRLPVAVEVIVRGESDAFR